MGGLPAGVASCRVGLSSCWTSPCGFVGAPHGDVLVKSVLARFGCWVDATGLSALLHAESTAGNLFGAS